MSRAEKKAKSGPDPLKEGLGAFTRGDVAQARVLLAAKADDASLSDAQREQARRLSDATHIERGALYTGLACIGLLLCVILITIWLQP
jgi:hypothetical protein